MESDRRAEIIAEELLELTGEALLNSDFEAFKLHFELPLRLETTDGHRFLETECAFKEVFGAWIRHLKNTRIEDFVRTVVFAEFVDAETIRSVHLSSEIRSGGELGGSAYPVHSTLVRKGAAWKITTCLYVFHDDPTRNRVFVDKVPNSLLRLRSGRR